MVRESVRTGREQERRDETPAGCAVGCARLGDICPAAREEGAKAIVTIVLGQTEEDGSSVRDSQEGQPPGPT